MIAGDSRARLDLIASRAVGRMEDLISTMEQAAEQIASGCSPEEISVKEYQIYMATGDQGSKKAVVCVLDSEEYIDLIDSAASETGISLEETAELEVGLPEVEFGENMITGGFGAFKGISVEMRSEPFEELLELVCQKLAKRGLDVRCIAHEEVIIYLPLRI